MRRHAVTRALAGLWSLWLAVTVVQDPAVRVCPMHGAPHRASSHAAHGAPGSHGRPAKQGSSSAHGHAAQASRSNPSQHADGCDCGDEGRCGVPMSAPPPASPTWRESIVVERVAKLVEARLVTNGRRAYALPFSNGPPLHLSSRS